MGQMSRSMWVALTFLINRVTATHASAITYLRKAICSGKVPLMWFNVPGIMDDRHHPGRNDC